MNALLTIVFYACAAVAVAGALGATLAPAHLRRLALLALAVGAAGALAALSAGLAALVALATLGAMALVVGSVATREGAGAGERRPPGRVRRAARPWLSYAGAAAAGLLLVALGYAAASLPAATGNYPGGAIGASAVGRLLFGRDAAATVAIAAVIMLAFAGGLWALGPGRRR